MKKPWKAIVTGAIVLIVIMVAIGGAAWYHLYHVKAQPGWITADLRDRYFYGSVGAGETPGIPYWVWLAMPRVFPEEMRVPGGYAALGMAWEEGKEMPVGFAKQQVGYIRVSGNCALCHVTTVFTEPDQAPQIRPAVSGKTTDLKPLLTFWQQCAADPRFNADELFSEIESDTSLSLWDKALYRYVLIPRIKQALLEDPTQVLFSPAIRAHWQNPRSEAPFADSDLRMLRDYVRQQSQPATP
jgi:hypothetical protein